MFPAGALFFKLRRRPNLSLGPLVQAEVRRLLSELPRLLFLVTMLAGAALITATSLVYFDFEALPPFALEKLPLRFEELWFAALRLHVASALVAFPLCLLLMTRFLQRRPAWHRRLGRVTGAAVLFALVPSGFVLAFDAKGGLVVSAGFLLSGALVFWFMLRGILAARLRELVAHRRAMLHVVAQMSVAVTSRTLMHALDLAGVDPDRAYVVALWVPVVASALIAEILARRPASFRSQPPVRSKGSPVKSLRWLSSCVLVLSFVPSLASADEQTLAERAKRRVEEGLVKPLAKVTPRKFSRERPPPTARTVRVTQPAGTPDKDGREFLTYAVDARYGSEVHPDDIVGCVYPASGAIFVKSGDEYRPASFLLGKKADPVAGACEAAPARS
jgi:uncharacterized membrane protein